MQTYAIESLLYRTAGLIDASIEQNGGPDAVLAAMEEFAIEASIAKVAGSETLHFVLDENVQIHGGNGFVKDYPAERHYRDARVNRIFEGTNEINRLLISGMLIRRAVKGDLALIPAARKLQDEILAGPGGLEPRGRRTARRADEPPCRHSRRSRSCRLGWRCSATARSLREQQEVLMVDCRYRDRGRVRGKRAAAGIGCRRRAWRRFMSMRRRSSSTMRRRAWKRGAKQLLAAMAEGDTLRTHLAALRRLLKVTPIDTVSRRRRIADETVRRGSYIFQ